MEITVAEARLLKNAVAEKLYELISERNRIAYVEFEKGEDYEKPNRTFEEVSADIKKVREHHRIIKKALAENNLKTTIDWKGEKLTIVEALELVKQLRAEASDLRRFGISNQVERLNSRPFDSKTFYRKAMFDPVKVKRDSEKILKEANRLSILIDKANFNATVNIDFVDEYQ